MDRGDHDRTGPRFVDVGEPDRHFAAECRIWNSLICDYPSPCDHKYFQGSESSSSKGHIPCDGIRSTPYAVVVCPTYARKALHRASR